MCVLCVSYCSLLVLQLYPYECQERLVDLFSTGDDVTVDLTTDTLKNNTTGESTIDDKVREKKKTLCTLVYFV